MALTGAAAALSVCSGSPSRGEERPDACDGRGETLAIYECQTGLVLWSRRQVGQRPPPVLSDKDLCRFVVGPAPPGGSLDQCP